MRKLNAYTDCSKEFFETVRDAKTDIGLQERLGLVENQVSITYDVYDDHFHNNNLTLLTPDPLLALSRDDLHSLYSYRSKSVRTFRTAVAALQPQALRYTCQYCTLSPVQSLDHYVPKESFPEFSVHTLNLVPCCSTCNGHKSNNWREGDDRLFINYYLDNLSEEQYLFVTISHDVNFELDFQFELINTANLPQKEFELLQSHFIRLKLFKRMKRAAVGVISELKNTMLSAMEKSSMDDVVDLVRSTAERNKLSYGSNHWKAVLELALVESDIFLSHLLN